LLPWLDLFLSQCFGSFLTFFFFPLRRARSLRVSHINHPRWLGTEAGSFVIRLGLQPRNAGKASQVAGESYNPCLVRGISCHAVLGIPLLSRPLRHLRHWRACLGLWIAVQIAPLNLQRGMACVGAICIPQSANFFFFALYQLTGPVWFFSLGGISCVIVAYASRAC
jgi:hypothetical protein